LARESFDFNRGFRRCNLVFTDLRFCLRWELQLRRLSKINRRYLTSSNLGIILLLNVTGGKIDLRIVKVTRGDLFSLIFIFYHFVHKLIILRWLWIIRQAVAKSWCDVAVNVSSANVPKKVKCVFGMSWVNTE
jgi:hypothetical protein